VIQQASYNYLDLDRVHTGLPVEKALEIELSARNCHRVAIVASQSIVSKTEIVSALQGQLGERCAGVFDQTVEHVPRSSVIELANFLRACKADIILTIGGGTPIDTVKTALVCLAENIDRAEQLDRFAIYVDDDGQRVTPAIANPPIRQIVVPTTLSGAEFSDLAGCVDPETGIKNLFSGPQIGAASVILDPVLTIPTPRNLWLSTGIRAIDHAVETICSSEPHPLADAGAFHALRLFAKSLPRNAEQPDDLKARLDSQTAVWLSCMGLNRVPYGASHGIGHQVGAQAGVPHGYTSCILLPHVMAFNHAASKDRQALISDAFGAPDRQAADLVAELISELGLPTRLRDVGVNKDQLDAIAVGSLQNAWVRGNIVPINHAEQVRDILDKAF